MLLRYPDSYLLESLDELGSMIDSLPEVHRGAFSKFIIYLKSNDAESLQENYVQTFDFEEKNCLYLTHSSYGARPERGVELLKINSQYKSAGLLLDAPELPDYLPVFLEYLSIAPESQSKNLVKEYIDSISKIKENLERSGSLYSIVLSACISAMNEMMGTRWNRFGFH